ncbi:Transposase DDE domain-containing protein [Cohaesibacter marisflavi]|uniref:Transposase DDE domain-containing protein n=1 Tax=Cohaesibacter marisflavi TaxID=655353 RepID=A0A1I5B4D4_9HYPH|nr:Transposase DDE domain-containing protein [Cohaesibacter marisflavi]
MSDYKMFEPLLDLPLARPRRFLADKGYDGDSVREARLFKGVNPVIPPKADDQMQFQRLSAEEPDRAHVQQAQAIPPHRNPL